MQIFSQLFSGLFFSPILQDHSAPPLSLLFPVDLGQSEQIIPEKGLMMKQIREPLEKCLAGSVGHGGQD